MQDVLIYEYASNTDTECRWEQGISMRSARTEQDDNDDQVSRC